MAQGEGGALTSFVKVGERRLRFDRVDKAGRITFVTRAGSITSESATPTPAGGVAMLIDGLDIEIVGTRRLTLRRLALDPTKDYQRIP